MAWPPDDFRVHGRINLGESAWDRVLIGAAALEVTPEVWIGTAIQVLEQLQGSFMVDGAVLIVDPRTGDERSFPLLSPPGAG